MSLKLKAKQYDILVTVLGDISSYLDKYIVYRMDFPNGKCYIGYTGHIYSRIEEHIRAMVKETSPVGRLLIRQGQVTVKCLRVCDSKCEAVEKEREFIHEYAKKIHNSITGSNTDYKSYSRYRHVIKQYLINRNEL